MPAPDLLKPGLRRVPLDRLFPHPENDALRTITDESLKRLIANLLARPDMLEARPIICDLDGAVIGGLQRWKAATVICTDPDVEWGAFQEKYKRGIPAYARAFPDRIEMREWMISDNAEFGDYVPDELARLVAEHSQEGDTEMLGLADAEVARLIAEHNSSATPPSADPPANGPVKAKSTFGKEVVCPNCEHHFTLE